MFLTASVEHAELLQEKGNISHGELGEFITANLTRVYDLLDKISLKGNPGVFYGYLSSNECNTIDIPSLDIPVFNAKTLGRK